MYIQRLENLGIKKTINKTRLKNALLEHYKGTLQEQTDGRNTVLFYWEAISTLLNNALKQHDFSEGAKILAMIVRKHIFAHKGFNFSGCFPMDCQSKYLPSSLRALVSLILNGLDINDQEKYGSPACLTVCEMIIFNAKKKSYNTKTGQTCHSASHEAPLHL